MLHFWPYWIPHPGREATTRCWIETELAASAPVHRHAARMHAYLLRHVAKQPSPIVSLQRSVSGCTFTVSKQLYPAPGLQWAFPTWYVPIPTCNWWLQSCNDHCNLISGRYITTMVHCNAAMHHCYMYLTITQQGYVVVPGCNEALQPPRANINQLPVHNNEAMTRSSYVMRHCSPVMTRKQHVMVITSEMTWIDVHCWLKWSEFRLQQSGSGYW